MAMQATRSKIMGLASPSRRLPRSMACSMAARRSADLLSGPVRCWCDQGVGQKADTSGEILVLLVLIAPP